MNWRKLTAWVIIITTGAIIIYDIFAYESGVPGATISRWIFDHTLAGKAWFPYFWASLLGHFFWPCTKKWGIKIFVIISIPFFLTLFFRIPIISDYIIIPVIVGGYSAHRFFSMELTEEQWEKVSGKKLKRWIYSL